MGRPWGRQLSMWSFNVAQDAFMYTLLKECGHMWTQSARITMLMPGLNRASEPAHNTKEEHTEKQIQVFYHWLTVRSVFSHHTHTQTHTDTHTALLVVADGQSGVPAVGPLCWGFPLRHTGIGGPCQPHVTPSSTKPECTHRHAQKHMHTCTTQCTTEVYTKYN